MVHTEAKQFGRLITAMVTPFDDQLNIDFKALEKIVNHLINTGTTSIVVNGTTGESPTLEDSEQKELLKTVIKFASGRAKIIMGTGTNCTAKTIKASQEAEQLGADAALVVVPYYNKPSQAGLLAHYSKLAKSVDLPIILYNIPGRTGINMTVETTLQLAQCFHNIVALKDSTNSTDQAAEVAKSAPPNFGIYSGDDYLTLPFLSIGGSGIISVASHLVGSQINEMITHYFNCDLDQARKLHYQYLPLFKALFAAPNPTCVKYALSKLNLCKPHLRLPLVPLDDAQAKTLDSVLDSVTLDEVDSKKFARVS